MTPQEAKQLLNDEKVKAYAEGKQLQWNSGTKENPSWVNDTAFCLVNFIRHNDRIRIKPEEPEPIRRWVNVYSDDSTAHYSTREAADSYARPGRIACVELVEVSRVEFNQGEKKK